MICRRDEWLGSSTEREEDMAVKITVEIPDELARQVGIESAAQLPRRVLEALVLEGYRSERIGGPQAAEFLGFSRIRWEQFLDEHAVLEGAYSVEDLERDVASLRELRASGEVGPKGLAG